MYTLHSALGLARNARLSSSLRLATPVNVAIRRTFRSTACRKVQYLDADTATLAKAISEENSEGKIVLVDFYAPWCGPCKMLSPILLHMTASENVDMVNTASGRTLDLVTVNTDEQPALAQKFGVTSLPTVVAFKDGEAVQQFIGALPEKGVRGFLAPL